MKTTKFNPLKWTAFLLVIFATPLLRAETNIIVNGDFEDWEKAKEETKGKGEEYQVAALIDNWTAKNFDFICEMPGLPPKVTITRDSEEKHGGKYSVRIESADEFQTGSVGTKELKIEPSSHYKVSVWYKTADLTGTFVGLWINQGPRENFWEVVKKDFVNMGPSPEWKLFETSFDTLPDSNNSNFFLQIMKSGGKVWFDDFSIVKTGKATAPVQSF